MTSDLNATIVELKKNIGKTVIQLNEDILVLQRIYKKRKLSKDKPLEKKELEVESRVKTAKENLEATIESLEKQPAYVTSEKLEKFVRMMTNTVETANILFTQENGYDVIKEETVKDTQEQVKSALEEVKNEKNKIVKTFDDLSQTLAVLSVGEEMASSVKAEFDALDLHKQERFRKIEKMVKKHMTDQTRKLESVWKDEKV